MAGEHVAKLGKIYFAASDVTTASATLGTYEGNVTVDITEEEVARRGQELVDVDAETVGMTYGITFERVHFTANPVIEDLFGITVATGSLQTAAAPTASVWNFISTTTPSTYQFLFSYTESDGSKTNQVKVWKGKMPSISIPFSATDWVVADLTLRTLKSSGGSMLSFYEEQ